MLSVVSSLTLAALAAAGPCDLLDKATAGAILGATVTQADPSGPEPDEDSGATRTSCVYMAGTRMLVVIRLDFPNAAAASQTANAEAQSEELAAEGATVKPETGVGDKAWLMQTRTALTYGILKGPTILSLALGGVPNPLNTYEAQLRTAAVAASKKL
jgi:hypothetical protein